MGKKNLRLLLLLTVCSILFLMIMSTQIFQSPTIAEPVLEPEPLRSHVSISKPIEEVETVVYTIGIWQGRVAVFENNAETPVTVLDTPVKALPLADQTALAQGISVCDHETLAGLLEDYGS